MEKNVGRTDKIIRVIVAVIAAYFGYTVNAWFYAITVIGLVTAATGFCGLYPLLGINTCKVKPKKKK